jgi:hypothetical protein
MPVFVVRPAVIAASLFGLAALSAAALAGSPATVDFSGAWRLDDQHSDTPDHVAALLRIEAKKEQAPQPDKGTASVAGTSGDDAHPSGGHGMGHGGGMGGMGGGHGHRGGRGGDASKHPADASGQPPDYPTPSWLSNDQVLIVQQDRQHVQVGLGNGEQLTLRFAVPLQQSLNGSAMVRVHQSDAGMQIAMTMADGSLLEQDWHPSADGRHLTLVEHWRVPNLQQPVSFTRSYVRLD